MNTLKPAKELKNKDLKENELVTSLDETLTVWYCEHGYYWYEKFYSCVSDKFFKKFKHAINDAKTML
jgi:hypothetical protein